MSSNVGATSRCFRVLLLALFIHSISSTLLNITNVTEELNQNNVFQSHSGAGMTYYTNPNDENKTKYVWYSVANEVDIYTPHLTPYQNTNAFPVLPFKTPNITMQNVCTSPTTNDIFTCFEVASREGPDAIYWIDLHCYIFFVDDNQWSNLILIQDIGLGVAFLSDVFCLHDSYFVANFDPENTGDFFYSLFDLKANIVANKVKLDIGNTSSLYPWEDGYPSGYLPIVFGRQQWLRNLGDDTATTSFMMLLPRTPNPDEFKPQYYAGYYYYTNIRDTKPVKLYSTSYIGRESPYQINDLDWVTQSIPMDDHCCYLTTYRAKNDPNYSSLAYTYVIVTDMYGEIMKVNGSVDNALIITNALWDFGQTVLYLNESLFMVLYGYNTTTPVFTWHADTIIAGVFSLEANGTENYVLRNVGVFPLSFNYAVYLLFVQYNAYIIPESNYLMLEYVVDYTNFVRYVEYAQTWQFIWT